MRPGSLLSVLALSHAATAAAVNSPESPSLLSRNVQEFGSRDLDLLSTRELEDLAKTLVDRSLLDDIWNKLKDATTCAGGEVWLS